VKTYVKTCAKIHVIIYVIVVDTSHTPEEGAHSPTSSNGLLFLLFHLVLNNMSRSATASTRLSTKTDPPISDAV
jgi:hypothetical protein